MKARIIMDPVSKCGILQIVPESGVEELALYHWWQNFNGQHPTSILHVVDKAEPPA